MKLDMLRAAALPPDFQLLAASADALAAYSSEADTADTSSVVRLVAQHKSNFLIRGNTPVDRGVLNLAAFQARLRQAAPLPDNYFVTDVSLTTDLLPKEHVDKQGERQFWRDHAQAGRLVSHPVYGTLSDPLDVPAATRAIAQRLPSIDRLPELVAQIHCLLDTSGPVPMVVYVHCQAGRDRTGEVIAAYGMEYQGQSYHQVLAEARSVAGRPLTRFNEFAIRWHAFYTRDVLGQSSVGTIDREPGGAAAAGPSP